MKSYLKAAAILFLALYFSNKAAEASIIINEAMIDPSEVLDTYGEWMELYNDGIEAVDINGWVIKDLGSPHTINDADLIIPAKGYVVLGRNLSLALNGGYVPDYVYGGSVYLGNEGDTITLEYPGQGVITQIIYNTSWPIEAGRSMAYDGEGDISDPANWFATPTQSQYIYGDGDYGTPGEANIPIVPEPSTALLLGSGILMLLSKRVKVSEYQSVKVKK